MKSKAIKITIGVIAGVLSLSTTAFAGFKVMKNNEGKVLSATVSPTATPEIIEQIEEIEEVTVINTNTAHPTSVSQPTNSPVTQTSVQPSIKSSSTPFAFDDDDDDDVEFEDDDEDEKDGEDDDEKDDSKDEDDN